MKLIIKLLILLTFSVSTMAGDTYINCSDSNFNPEDDFIAMSAPMAGNEKEWKIAISFEYPNQLAPNLKDSIVITAKRILAKDRWVIRSIVIDSYSGGFSEFVFELEDAYATIFKVSDKISCMILD